MTELAQGQGFFSPKAIAERQAEAPIKAKKRTVRKNLDCEHCGAYKASFCKSPQMDAHGKGLRDILIIGEAPGETEDEEGKQLVGDSGNLIREAMTKRGLVMNRDAVRVNAVNCYLGKDKKGDFKKPTKKQLDCCRVEKVKPTIEETKPKYIWLLGNYAIESFYAGRTKLKVTALQGRVIPDKETGAWVIPMFHPSYVLRQRGDENLRTVWERSIIRAANKLSHEPPEFPDPEPHIECITEFEPLVKTLNAILEFADEVVIDYETSGLKPHRFGHRIHSVSLAFSLNGEEPRAISFPLHYPGHWKTNMLRVASAAKYNIAHPNEFNNDKLRAWCDPLAGEDDQLAVIEKLVVEILRCERIKKIAHNMKFEDMWSQVILGVKPKPWHFDTILGAHVVDNTPGITGLKTQAWMLWGVEDYDAEFAKYREAYLTQAEKKVKAKPSDNHFNRVGEMPLPDLLKYGGYDGILEYWLYKRQQRQLRPGTMLADSAYRLLHDGAEAFMDMLEEGVPVDEDYYRKKVAEYHQRIEDLEKDMRKMDEFKLFKEKEGREIDYGSNPDLGHLFYTLLEIEPPKKTATGRPSVDKEAFHAIDNEFARMILQRRSLLKIADTYMDQITREAVNGRLFPSINLNTVVTYRSSMNAPNLQNTPKREEEPKIAVRTGIVAEPGCHLLETDFGGIEVCGLQWYANDPVLGEYLWSADADMHRDQAQNIFDIRPKEWEEFDTKAVKLLRFYIKNGWVFPQFYGAWYKSCAENIWDNCADLPIGDDEGTTVRQWLGMSYPQFEEHLRSYEGQFWETFKGVRDYQDEIGKEYRKYGYIETHLGFRFRAWMTRNNLYNYKVQGTAFHLLLWSLVEMNKLRKSRGWKSRILWQIHDSIVWNLHPEEREAIIRASHHVMSRRAPQVFPWINTPIKIEPEITDLDGTFADLTEYDEDAYEDLAAA